jgi:hypothetical protein
MVLLFLNCTRVIQSSTYSKHVPLKKLRLQPSAFLDRFPSLGYKKNRSFENYFTIAKEIRFEACIKIQIKINLYKSWI